MSCVLTAHAVDMWFELQQLMVCIQPCRLADALEVHVVLQLGASCLEYSEYAFMLNILCANMH